MKLHSKLQTNSRRSNKIKFQIFLQAGQHGSVSSVVRHAGDLGNIVANEDGKATFNIILMPDSSTKLFGPNTIIGRTLVIHAGEDDLGLANTSDSASTGSAGSRLACAIIEEKIDEEKALEWYIYLLIALVAILLLIVVVFLILRYCNCKK